MQNSDRAVQSPVLQARAKKLRANEVHARAALRKNPTDEHGLCTLAHAVFDRGDDLEAIRLLNQVIHSKPGHFRAYYWLASMYYQLGKTTAAAQVYREWRRVDPPGGERQHEATVTSERMTPEDRADQPPAT